MPASYYPRYRLRAKRESRGKERFGMHQRLVSQFKSSDPFFLSDCLDVKVRFEDLPESVRGFYAKMGGMRYIVINCNIKEELQRFICAHELAHAVLHSSLNYYLLTEATLFNTNKFEREANLWAIRLLGYGHHLHEGETMKHFYMRIGVPIGLFDREVIPSEWREHSFIGEE